MKVTICLEKAPAFIAALVREGVQFEAEEGPGDNVMIITFSGGF